MRLSGTLPNLTFTTEETPNFQSICNPYPYAISRDNRCQSCHPWMCYKQYFTFIKNFTYDLHLKISVYVRFRSQIRIKFNFQFEFNLILIKRLSRYELCCRYSINNLQQILKITCIDNNYKQTNE